MFNGRRQSSLVHRVAVFVMLCGGLGAARPALAEKIDYEKQIIPLLKKYCYGCHREGKTKGDLNLEPFTTALSVAKERKLFDKAVDQVQIGDMPPPDDKKAPRPDDQETALLLRGLRAAMDSVDCKTVKDPGAEPARRLSRYEYVNTIRDLIGIDYDPTDRFPADSGSEGFDNIGLTIAPALMEKYLEVTEQVLDKAIVPSPRTVRFDASKMQVRTEAEAPAAGDKKDDKAAKPAAGGHAVEGGKVTFTAKGEVFVTYSFPVDGAYMLKAKASGTKAGNAPVRMGLNVDGKVERGFSVTADREFQAQIRVNRGGREVSVAFLNPYHDERALDAAKADRKLTVDWMEITGPISNPSASQKAAHDRIFIVEAGKSVKDRDAARQIVEAFARRAWRGPVDSADADRLLKLYDFGREKQAAHEQSVRLMLQAVLMSPRFIYRIEDEKASDEPWKISDQELAVRLSYFLWSTMPDQELTELADQNKLSSPKTLEKQVERMLKDPRLIALSENFAGQWLTFKGVMAGDLRPDRTLFPEFTTSLRQSMYQEGVEFFNEIIRENRSILDIVDADYTYLNEELAKHYDIKGVSLSGSQMRRVKLRDRNRGGVLGMGSFLAVTSYSRRTNPIIRGTWILDRILGTPAPEPPPVVPDIEAALKKDGEKKTLREMLEQHRVDAACAGCHKKIDPIGFGFENFDAVGRWRVKDNGKKIDSTGVLPSGERFKDASELKDVLMKRKDLFAANVTERMMTYALGRSVKFYDRCAVKDIVEKLEKDKYAYTTLVKEIVQSYPFQYKRKKD